MQKLPRKFYDRKTIEVARDLLADGPPTEASRRFAEVLAYTTMQAPSFSLRGGTREILRGIIARGLGLR